MSYTSVGRVRVWAVLVVQVICMPIYRLPVYREHKATGVAVMATSSRLGSPEGKGREPTALTLSAPNRFSAGKKKKKKMSC